MTLSDSWQFWVFVILFVGLPMVHFLLFKVSRIHLALAVILIAVMVVVILLVGL